MRTQALEDFTKVHLVLRFGVAKDKDVIKVYGHEHIKTCIKDYVHETLEG